MGRGVVVGVDVFVDVVVEGEVKDGEVVRVVDDTGCADVVLERVSRTRGRMFLSARIFIVAGI